MDLKKPELSESELQTLCAFISRKGFGEPALVLEILDHFACKVEELSTQYPTWPLEKRMEEAHRQFGVAGFYPLVKSYEEGLQRHYNRYFRSSLFGVFTHARSLGLVILVPLLVYVFSLLLMEFSPALRFSGMNPQTLAALGTFLCFAAAAVVYLRPFRKSKNVFMRAAMSSWYGSIFTPGLFFLFVPLQHPLPLPVLLILAVLAAVWEQARYATLRQALEDYNEKVSGFRLAG